VQSRVDDVLDAAEYCRRETQATEIFLLGLCYGATLAVSAALSSQSVAGVIAWSPILDGERYAGELLRADLTAQMVLHRKIIHDREALAAQILSGTPVNIEGYEIGKALYGEMSSMRLTSQLRDATKPVLVVQIAPGERVDAQYAELAQPGHGSVSFEAVRELKFWTQQKSVFPPCERLFELTTDWLSRQAS
jgi:hypothetical protein